MDQGQKEKDKLEKPTLIDNLSPLGYTKQGKDRRYETLIVPESPYEDEKQTYRNVARKPSPNGWEEDVEQLEEIQTMMKSPREEDNRKPPAKFSEDELTAQKESFESDLVDTDEGSVNYETAAPKKNVIKK